MEKVTRRKMLGTAAGGGVALATLILGPAAAQAATLSAQKRGRRKGKFLVVEVVPDFTTLDFIREVAPGDTFPTGPFFVQGSIYRDGSVDNMGEAGDSTPIGTYKAWGWISDGMTGEACLAQSFDYNNNGMVQLQGPQTEWRAVTGGTDRFRNVRGEARFEDINVENMSFRAYFKFQGAGNKLKDGNGDD